MINDSVRSILKQCEKTASWDGVAIERLDQRNSMNDTPLHTVCTWGDVYAVNQLLKAGVDVNALGDRGCTPLFNAVMSENSEVVKALLNAGADTRIPSIDGRSVLRYAENVRAPDDVLKLLRNAP